MVKKFGLRRFTSFGLLFALLLFVVACSTEEPAAEPTTPAELPATVEPAAEVITETTTTTDSAALTESVASEAAPSTTDATSSETAATTFAIVTEGTEARFFIDEVLLGQDKTVVGTTSLVEGQITVDPADPSSATISPIRIDARDLTTDSDRRNGAISRFVLESEQDDYQYILFTPTSIEGMPATVTMNEPFEFTVIGDLTIRDITKEERFTVTVTANSATELVGLGQATLLRSDYELTIPSVPSVANVAEEVPLEIEFTAVAS